MSIVNVKNKQKSKLNAQTFDTVLCSRSRLRASQPNLWFVVVHDDSDETKSVFLGDLDSALDIYSFLTTEYKFDRTNLGHYDEDKTDFVINYIGRNSYEIPYMVTSVKIFLVFVENGVYKKVYYEVA